MLSIECSYGFGGTSEMVVSVNGFMCVKAVAAFARGGFSIAIVDGAL